MARKIKEDEHYKKMQKKAEKKEVVKKEPPPTVDMQVEELEDVIIGLKGKIKILEAELKEEKGKLKNAQKSVDASTAALTFNWR